MVEMDSGSGARCGTVRACGTHGGCRERRRILGRGLQNWRNVGDLSRHDTFRRTGIRPHRGFHRPKPVGPTGSGRLVSNWHGRTRWQKAPWISSVRRYRSPRLLMPSSVGFPPVERCCGTMPSQVASSRPLRHSAASPTAATSAVDVSGPTPGIASSRSAP